MEPQEQPWNRLQMPSRKAAPAPVPFREAFSDSNLSAKSPKGTQDPGLEDTFWCRRSVPASRRSGSPCRTPVALSFMSSSNSVESKEKRRSDTSDAKVEGVAARECERLDRMADEYAQVCNGSGGGAPLLLTADVATLDRFCTTICECPVARKSLQKRSI